MRQTLVSLALLLALATPTAAAPIDDIATLWRSIKDQVMVIVESVGDIVFLDQYTPGDPSEIRAGIIPNGAVDPDEDPPEIRAGIIPNG